MLINGFILIFLIFVFVQLLLNVLQIRFIKQKSQEKAVLMEEKAWKFAASYAIQKENFEIYSNLFSLVIFFAWISFGFSAINNALAHYNPTSKAIIFVLCFLGINYVLGLPLSYYKTFVVDKDFNKMTLVLFLKDELKSVTISTIIITILVALVSVFIEGLKYWWIYAFVSLFVFIVLVNMLYPTIRAKFFDNFTSLDDSELAHDIKAMLEKNGLFISGIFSVDASKRDSRLNAYFGGLGKTKRVVLFDTLLEKLSKTEILAVLGHELGHFVHKDILKNIASMGGFLFVILAIFGNIDKQVLTQIGMSGDSASLIVFFLMFSSPLFFFLMPILNYISRKNEFAADAFGAKVQDAKSLADALSKLTTQNKHFPFSHNLYAIFYHTHPNVIERIKILV